MGYWKAISMDFEDMIEKFGEILKKRDYDSTEWSWRTKGVEIRILNEPGGFVRCTVIADMVGTIQGDGPVDHRGEEINIMKVSFAWDADEGPKTWQGPHYIGMVAKTLTKIIFE